MSKNKLQVRITNTVFADVDFEALANMAFRIKAASNISLFEVEKSLKGLKRDLDQNEQIVNRIEYALRQLTQTQNMIDQIEKFYIIKEVVN